MMSFLPIELTYWCIHGSVLYSDASLQFRLPLQPLATHLHNDVYHFKLYTSKGIFRSKASSHPSSISRDTNAIQTIAYEPKFTQLAINITEADNSFLYRGRRESETISLHYLYQTWLKPAPFRHIHCLFSRQSYKPIASHNSWLFDLPPSPAKQHDTNKHRISFSNRELPFKFAAYGDERIDT